MLVKVAGRTIGCLWAKYSSTSARNVC
jgi:hypothetical protein